MKQYPIDLHRFDKAIARYTEMEPETGGILLYGSSFFANWGTDAALQMNEASGGRYHIVNRGFGGATADELLYHFHRLVLPNEPKAIVFRMGANDVFRSFTPFEAWNTAWRLLEFARADFPGIRLILLGIFDFRSAKDEHKPKFAEFDRYQKEYADQTENVDFLNISEFFYESPENVGTFTGFRDIFREDGLHLTPEAYIEFSHYFTEKLQSLGL